MKLVLQMYFIKKGSLFLLILYLTPLTDPAPYLFVKTYLTRISSFERQEIPPPSPSWRQ